MYEPCSGGWASWRRSCRPLLSWGALVPRRSKRPGRQRWLVAPCGGGRRGAGAGRPGRARYDRRCSLPRRRARRRAGHAVTGTVRGRLFGLQSGYRARRPTWRAPRLRADSPCPGRRGRAGRGCPPGVPHWTLASPQGDGPLRINLPSASATGVSDGEFGEGPAVGFHVVRAPKGGMFVDFTARRAFRYRALALPDPARLVADFERAGPSPYKPPPAARGDRSRRASPRGRGLRSPRRRRLLLQLRGLRHHSPRDARGRAGPQDRHGERLEPHLGILRGDPGPAAVLWYGPPAGRGRGRR